MKKSLTALLCLTALATAWAGKPLDHDAFDAWKAVRMHALSDDGRWAAYTVNPQQGDGRLIIRSTSGKETILERGANPKFLSGSKYLVAKILPPYDATRSAKIAGKKGLDLPQDSLAIVNLSTGHVERIPQVLSFAIGKDGGDWLAYTSCDTIYAPLKGLKDKESGNPLILRNLLTGVSRMIPWVDSYSFSRMGDRFAFFTSPWEGDSTATADMYLVNLPDTTLIPLLGVQNHYGKPVFSHDGRRMAFTASMDSAETGTRRYDTYMVETTAAEHEAKKQYVLQAVNEGRMPHIMPPRITDESKRDSIMAEMRRRLKEMAGDSIFVNQYSTPIFSHDGNRLIIGVARYIAPDDTTIVDFEQPALDIWRWDAPKTPPQENINIDDLRSHTMPVVIDLDTYRDILITDSPYASWEAGDRWDGDWVLVRNPGEDIISQQWDYAAPETLYLVNLKTQERREIGKAPIDNSDISPAGKYVYWWEGRHWHVYDIATGKSTIVDSSVPYPLWEEAQDIPLERQPYGLMGWTQDDAAMLVYDRHDIWSLDPKGEKAPVNLTKGEGRKKNLRLRHHVTDPEQRYFTPKDNEVLEVFDYATKKYALGTLLMNSNSTPRIGQLQPYMFYQLRKARKADSYGYLKGNFETIPEAWLAPQGVLGKAVQVTDVNAQKQDYTWGKAQLVDWYAYDGRPSQGVLYTPDDLDPDKKYPMLVVFYETNSEYLYHHYTMEPSWSWVNYPFYVSRGYVVFVPDVHYYAGIPGESAYNYICSGVDDLCDKYPWIDRDRIGIDGQSWGGYQTAYLITRTDMFACAGSGAPVSNMTSAFGGIRWESGESRQAQYEVGQSRIGRNLWEAPELYVAASPLFKADRVHTPLLIMHNDEDGAVPWYQGIEYFMALRRLGKPVWMLQYNGEAHNIRARKNRRDITHRLQEFFDHYLKGTPMPRWMKEGIPALRKGQELRYGN